MDMVNYKFCLPKVVPLQLVTRNTEYPMSISSELYYWLHAWELNANGLGDNCAVNFTFIVNFRMCFIFYNIIIQVVIKLNVIKKLK